MRRGRSSAGTAPASAPLPTTASSGRRDQSRRKAGQCWARLATLHSHRGPQRLLAPGSPSCRAKFASQPCLHSQGGRRWPPTSPSAAPPSSPRGGAPAEDPRGRSCESRIGRAREGARKGSSARIGSRAQEQNAAALPEGPAAARRVFGLGRGCGATSVRYGSWPGRRRLPAILARLPLWPAPIESGRGPAISSPPGLWPPADRHRRPPLELEEKVK